MKTIADNRFLRLPVLIAAPIGAAGSLVFMFRVGHRNQSVVLMILFTAWVLAPFLAMVWANRHSERWPARPRTVLRVIILLLTPGLLLAYGTVALGAPRAQPAFMFLVAPLCSLLLIGMALLIGGFIARTPRNGEKA